MRLGSITLVRINHIRLSKGIRGEMRPRMGTSIRRGLFWAWLMLSVVWSGKGLKSMLDWHQRMTAILPDFGWPYAWVADRVITILSPWILMVVVLGLIWTVRGVRSVSEHKRPFDR